MHGSRTLPSAHRGRGSRARQAQEGDRCAGVGSQTDRPAERVERYRPRSTAGAEALLAAARTRPRRRRERDPTAFAYQTRPAQGCSPGGGSLDQEDLEALWRQGPWGGCSDPRAHEARRHRDHEGVRGSGGGYGETRGQGRRNACHGTRHIARFARTRADRTAGTLVIGARCRPLRGRLLGASRWCGRSLGRWGGGLTGGVHTARIDLTRAALARAQQIS